MQDVFVGVDVGGTRIKIGLAERSGHLVSLNVLETRNCRDIDSFLETVVSEICNQAKTASAPVRAVGIGCPGLINFKSGMIVWLRSKLEFLEGFPLSERFAERLACPVVCDNDVNAILTGEIRFGAGQGYQDVIGVTVGTGIGGAVFLGGRMIRGRHWATGHFGYMSQDPLGIKHVCGNTGIVEEYASHSGILRQIRRALAAGEVSSLTELLTRGKEPGLRELFEAADSGDPLGCRLAEGLTSALGVMIANIIYALDPELVLVGGGIVSHRPALLDAIQREVAERVGYLSADATKIAPMALGDAAGVLGGVALAIDASALNQQILKQGEKR